MQVAKLKNNQELVDHLIDTGALRTENIIQAFQSVERSDFVEPRASGQAFGDYPLRIAAGQTISQPTTVAHMLEWLQPQAGDKALDVGSGSGWTTALLANITGKQGQVVGVEIQPELVEFGKRNLEQYDYSQIDIKKAKTGVLGWPEEAPYDRILVSAAGDKLPKELIKQLTAGGRMVAPVKNSIYVINKNKQGIDIVEHPGFVFVPLVEK